MEPGDRVANGRRRGEFIRYETKFRTRWAVVWWDGKPFTEREYPHAIEPLEEVSMPEQPAKTTRPGNPPKPPER